jgi:DNA-binding GntR family transcriptional regulator
MLRTCRKCEKPLSRYNKADECGACAVIARADPQRARAGLTEEEVRGWPLGVDPYSDRAVYKQLADLIRDQIQRGDLKSGQRLPGENTYMQEHGISRHSVRLAMAVVRGEGLIVTTRRGSRVQHRPTLRAVRVEQGSIHARMPTEPERRAMDIDEGVPMLIVECPGQEQQIYSADRTEIRIG